MFHVPEGCRERSHPVLGSTTDDGNNGAFLLASPEHGWMLFAIASDEGGWEHVSVHAQRRHQQRTPTWREMHFMKCVFWDAEDLVMQLHPPRSTYVNTHPYTLHLWRPTAGEIPVPPMEFV